MDIVSALAPPRVCRLAGQTLWVRPYTLEDFAVVLAWLDDVTPGKAARKIAPRLTDPSSQEAIETISGRTVTAWTALRHQGLTWGDVIALVSNATDEEWTSFLSVVFSGRRTSTDAGGDSDLADCWIGPSLVSLCTRFPGHSIHDLGRLTLDQYAMLCGDGIEHEDPKRLTDAQVEEMRQEGLRIQAERSQENMNGTLDDQQENI